MYENRGFLPPRHVTYELAQYRLLDKLECLYSNKISFQLTCDRLVTCFKGVQPSFPATIDLHSCGFESYPPNGNHKEVDLAYNAKLLVRISVNGRNH